MQRAAMNADFGKLVPGRLAARLLVDELPEAVEKQLSAFSIPARSRMSPSPSAVNSRIPCGSSVMPTPSSFSSGAAS
jgi:hypothetical protein